MGYLRLLRRPPILVLWSSMALSVLGDRLYGLAVMWMVFEATGRAWLMGLVAVAESVPYILLGSAGRRVVARFASFRALAWVDAGRAAAACAVPLLWRPDTAGFVVLLILVLLLGTLGAVFDPNLGALVPDLVAPGEVRQVTGLIDLTVRIAAVAGPGSVGLLLLALSEVQLFALDGATFAVSALALGWLGRRTAHRCATDPAIPKPAAVRAWPVLRRHPRVGVAIGLHGVGLFVAAVPAVGMPVLLAQRLDLGAGGYGLVLATIAAGALVGNLLVGHVTGGSWLTVYCGAWLVSGLASLGMGTATSLAVLVGFAFVSGLATPWAAVTLRARLGGFAAGERLRLITVDHAVIRALGTAGMLSLPLAVDASPAAAFVAAGLLLMAVAAAAGMVGARLRPDRVPAEQGPADAAPPVLARQ